MKKAIAFITALCMLGLTLQSNNDHHKDINITAYAETNESIYEDGFTFVIFDSEAHIIQCNYSYFFGKDEIIIPDKINDLPVTEISFKGVYGDAVEKIKRISLSSFVTDIQISDFEKFKHLDTIDVKENNPNFSSDEGVLYSKDKKTLIKYPTGKEEKRFEIPDNVEHIGNSAFYNCSYLESIEIPKSVADIGSSAFFGCSNLISIRIPDSINEIKQGTFSNCISLESIDLPDCLITISEGAFDGCSSLESIDFPDCLITIGEGAFYGCSSLESIIIPKNVTEIRTSTFSKCTNLIDVTLPSELKYIGTASFFECSKLRSIEIPPNVIEIDTAAFENCLNLHTVILPDSLKIIGSASFVNCRQLWRINIPGSVTEIKSAAFADCSGLIFAHFNDGITKIDTSAFRNCSKLKSVELPKTINEIGQDAFYNCKDLKTVTILNPFCTIGNQSSDINTRKNTFTNRVTNEKTSTPLFKGILYGVDGSSTEYFAMNSDYTFMAISESSTPEQVDQDPIIIVPGIMGSRLFKDKDCNDLVWDPDPNIYKYSADIAIPYMFVPGIGGIISTLLLSLPEDALFDLKERININNELFVSDPSIDQNKITNDGREYGAIHHLKVTEEELNDEDNKNENYDEIGLLDTLCKEFPDREIYVFSYDWRKSNDTSARALDKFVNSLNADKVDIVAHSMGGLVSSCYYTKYGGDKKIDKIITCGTPYEGAPHLFEAVEQGKITDKDLENNAMKYLGDLSRDTISEFDGVLELIPTLKYNQSTQAENFSPPVMKLEIGDTFSDTVHRKLSNDEYLDILENEFDKESIARAIVFQDNIRDKSGYNVLLNYDNAYFILGQNRKTVQTVYMEYDPFFDGSVLSGFSPGYYLSGVKYTKSGDGTVPYTSSSMCGMTFMRRLDHQYTVDSKHMDLMKNAESIDCICKLLKNETPTTPHYFKPDDYCEITVACPVDVEIGSDDDRLCSSPNSLSFASSFGRLDILGKDYDKKMICMDEDTNLDINLTGTNTGTMDFSVRHYSGEDELLDERIFVNVPITDKTIIKTKADNNEETILSIDHNGDGIIDETWTAKKNETVNAPDENININTTTTSSATNTSETTTTSVTTTQPQVPTEPDYTLGEVNGDGKIDASDASEVLVEYAKLSTGETPGLTDTLKLSADVNFDGKIDAADASDILSYYGYLSTGGTFLPNEYFRKKK